MRYFIELKFEEINEIINLYFRKKESLLKIISQLIDIEENIKILDFGKAYYNEWSKKNERKNKTYKN